jgi:hypothetical protein
MVIAAPARFAMIATVSAAALACEDPVHDQLVASLGPENPNVPPGQLHRPGQPCLACHGGEGPASAQFSVGGTVYAVRGQPGPAVGARVQVQDIEGRYWTSELTNAVGNFFVFEADFAPAFPIRMEVFEGKTTQQMQTYAARDGSCADCHSNPAGPTSAGPVYVFVGDGGAP